MMAYQKINVMKDVDRPGKIVVEDENNTYAFYDCTVAEVAEFIRTIHEED